MPCLNRDPQCAQCKYSFASLKLGFFMRKHPLAASKAGHSLLLALSRRIEEPFHQEPLWVAQRYSNHEERSHASTTDEGDTRNECAWSSQLVHGQYVARRCQAAIRCHYWAVHEALIWRLSHMIHPLSSTMVSGSTQPLKETSTTKVPGDKGR
jgi:hypothetical protein